MPDDVARYPRYRFPRAIISHAVWLYYRFTLSFRDVEDLLAQRGITVSYESIRHWCGPGGPSSFRCFSRSGLPLARARLCTSRFSRSGISWRRESIAPPGSSSDRGGSGALGIADADMERLAAGARPRQAGHRARLAPTRVSPVLDMEESPPYGSSGSGPRGSRVDFVECPARIRSGVRRGFMENCRSWGSR